MDAAVHNSPHGHEQNTDTAYVQWPKNCAPWYNESQQSYLTNDRTSPRFYAQYEDWQPEQSESKHTRTYVPTYIHIYTYINTYAVTCLTLQGYTLKCKNNILSNMDYLPMIWGPAKNKSWGKKVTIKIPLLLLLLLQPPTLIAPNK